MNGTNQKSASSRTKTRSRSSKKNEEGKSSFILIGHAEQVALFRICMTYGIEVSHNFLESEEFESDAVEFCFDMIVSQLISNKLSLISSSFLTPQQVSNDSQSPLNDFYGGMDANFFWLNPLRPAFLGKFPPNNMFLMLKKNDNTDFEQDIEMKDVYGPVNKPTKPKKSREKNPPKFPLEIRLDRYWWENRLEIMKCREELEKTQGQIDKLIQERDGLLWKDVSLSTIQLLTKILTCNMGTKGQNLLDMFNQVIEYYETWEPEEETRSSFHKEALEKFKAMKEHCTVRVAGKSRQLISFSNFI
jgi:hypothetical protein